MTNPNPFIRRRQDNTGFLLFEPSGSAVINQPYNPGTGDVFHSKEEIYEYVTSSIMVSPPFQLIDDLTDNI